MVTASVDGTLNLWNLATVDPAPQRGPPLPGTGIHYQDGRLLAVSTADNALVLHDTTDTALRPVGRPLPISDVVAFSGDGSLLAIGNTTDNTVTLWDFTDVGNPRATEAPIRIGSSAPPDTLEYESLAAVALSSDGGTLATSTYPTGVRLWDITDRAHVRAVGGVFGATADLYPSLAFSRDGSRLVNGQDGGSTVWDITDRVRPVAHPVGGVHPRLMPDDRTLVTVVDGSVLLWDVTDPGHPSAVGQPFGSATGQVASSQDGRTLAVVSGDDEVALWDLTDRTRPRPIGKLVAADGVSAISFSPDGHTVAVTTSSQVVLRDLFRLDEARRDPLGQACARAGPLSPALWSTYVPGLGYRNACAGR
jgi:WD40 repeat protein